MCCLVLCVLLCYVNEEEADEEKEEGGRKEGGGEGVAAPKRKQEPHQDVGKNSGKPIKEFPKPKKVRKTKKGIPKANKT